MSAGVLHRMSLAAVLGLAVGLSGCASLLGPRGSPPRLHLLELPETPRAAASQGAPTLAVGPGSAAPGYATADMAYRQEGTRLDYYRDSRWVAPPATMITAELIERLAARGPYAAVIPAPAAAEQRLDLHLLRLDQDFRSGLPSRLHLVVRATLVDGRTGALLASRRLEAVEPAGNDAAAGAAAAGHALDRIAETLTGLLKRMAEPTRP